MAQLRIPKILVLTVHDVAPKILVRDHTYDTCAACGSTAQRAHHVLYLRALEHHAVRSAGTARVSGFRRGVLYAFQWVAPFLIPYLPPTWVLG